MKRTLSIISAALVVGALALPVLAQDSGTTAVPSTSGGTTATAPAGRGEMSGGPMGGVTSAAKPKRATRHKKHKMEGGGEMAAPAPAASPAPAGN
jgi:hypothetical protein